MKKINSTDIARLAGVSRSTVSRVVNGYTNVPEETRKKVMKVIKENEYYPSLSGQLLAGKRTGTIGFFWVSERHNIAGDFLTSSFFVHVTEATTQMGYLVLACIVDNFYDKNNVNRIKKIFAEGRIDAGVFIGADNCEPLVEDLIASGKIVGLFDHFDSEKTEPNRISVNFERETGEKTIDYLASMGHTKIAVIDGNMSRYSSMQRHESYIRGMQKHNIKIRSEWMRYGDIVEEGGYMATKELLKYSNGDLPTAICANNDGVAFGAYRALAEAGISVPEQVSVIGIDGHQMGEFSSPPLTTFGFNYKEMFTSLVSRTIRAVEHEEDIPQTDFIKSELIERNSVLNIKDKTE